MPCMSMAFGVIRPAKSLTGCWTDGTIMSGIISMVHTASSCSTSDIYTTSATRGSALTFGYCRIKDSLSPFPFFVLHTRLPYIIFGTTNMSSLNSISFLS